MSKGFALIREMWVTLFLFPLYVVEFTIFRLIDLFGCPFRARYADGRNRVVFISGCDSGIGHLIARHAYELGFIVFAGVYDTQSHGAACLQTDQFDRERMHVVPLDVTDRNSCSKAAKEVAEYLVKRPEARFHALLNNAGVCIAAEMHWLTDRQVENQIAVNYRGVIWLTQSFTQLLIESKGRLLNVGSINGRYALPGTLPSLWSFSLFVARLQTGY